MIVVGTTPDYVLRIHEKSCSQPVFFLLDSRYRNDPDLTTMDNSLLIFSNLADFNESLCSLESFLSIRNFNRPWFACFDCESLYVTSMLADYYKSPFPSTRSILMTRNKFLAGKIWGEAGLDNPRSGLASDLSQTIRLFEKFNRDVVLKPLSGSGSELLFHCCSESEVIDSVKIMSSQLVRRKDNPLYADITDPSSSRTINPREEWIVEEYVDGSEFSCDFILHNKNIKIIRETGKIKAPDSPFGTVMCYTVPPVYPLNFSKESLEKTLMSAVRNLGYDWGYFMADFIIRDARAIIIELTPRPGGDSLPDLIMAASGEDTLKIYLELITGQYMDLNTVTLPSKPCASINFFAPREGIIEQIDYTAILSQPDFITFIPKKKKGDRLSLPPDDYDNRLIGYCVVSHENDWDPMETCHYYQGLLKVSIH